MSDRAIVGGSTVSRSIDRVFAVIELFDERRAPLTATEISRALNLRYSSIYYVLERLAEKGYLSRSQSPKTYFPTLKLVERSHWIAERLSDRGALQTIVDALADEIGESASLWCAEDIFARLIYAREVGVKLPKGGIGAPLCQSAVGRVLLSERSDAQIAATVEATNIWSSTARAGFRFSIEPIMRSVLQTRRDGYLLEVSRWLPNTSSFIALFTGRHGGSAVIGISGEDGSVARQAILDHGTSAPAGE